MAAGAIAFKITGWHVDATSNPVVVTGNATKWLTDDDGVDNSLGSWTGTVTYTGAAFASKTSAQIRADLITEIKAKNAAVSAKTIT